MMYTTYHLSSAQEVNSDILDAIKAVFKSKPITIIVESNNVSVRFKLISSFLVSILPLSIFDKILIKNTI